MLNVAGISTKLLSALLFGHHILIGHCHLCRSANVREALSTAIMLVDVSYPKWRILFCNGQFDRATGLSGLDLAGQHVWDHFTVVGKSEVSPAVCAASVRL